MRTTNENRLHFVIQYFVNQFEIEVSFLSTLSLLAEHMFQQVLVLELKVWH